MSVQVSIRQQLINALCAKLPDGDTVKQVYRSLTQAVQADNLPVCAVFPIEETSEHIEHEPGMFRTLRLNIVYVAAKTDADESAALDQVVDSALVWIEQKVTEDATLGGLGYHTHVPRIQWQLESGEFGFVGAVLETEIEYMNQEDPTQPEGE